MFPTDLGCAVWQLMLSIRRANSHRLRNRPPAVHETEFSMTNDQVNALRRRYAELLVKTERQFAARPRGCSCATKYGPCPS